MKERKNTKELDKKVIKKQRGITLIALVITIIVLLILAGVGISMLTGENGILSQAQKAKEETELSSEKEKIKLAVQSSIAKNTESFKITKTNLDESIEEQLGNNRQFEIIENNDGSFLVNLKSPDRKYYIEETGKVISEENMLKITTVEELKSFRDDVNSGNTYEGWYVYLTNNITLDTNQEWKPIGLYPMENSSPDDETNKPFKGTFDGCEYEIDGIYINSTDKVKGLFGIIADGGIVKNLKIGENSSIKGKLAAGGVVGYAYNGARVINCKNYANIEVETQIGGGVVGILNNNCECIDSINFGEIKGNNIIGGVSGSCMENSSMKNCINNGQVFGVEIVGGISGTLKSSAIGNCANYGVVSDNNNSETKFIGGIIGEAESAEIIECYNVGEISGNQGVAGIVGWGYNMKINSCYNNALVTGTSKVSGICGIVGLYGKSSNNYIENCYNSKNITFSTLGGAIANYVISGEALDLKNNYYLENTVNNSNEVISINGVETRNDGEMKNLALSLGGKFKADTNNINNGYPILSWQ